MKRVLVIGCPGSGKSTFSRELRDKTGIPLYYLDMIFHRSDRTTVSDEEFDRELYKILEKDSYILDGNYARTLSLRLKYADTVFFLDYPVDICLEGINTRRGTKREDMPWIEIEPDKEFIEFVKNFNICIKPKIEHLLSEYPNINKIVFSSRSEAEKYLRKPAK